MSKRNAGLFVLVVLLAGLTWLGDAAAAPASDWDIELFARPGCPRCAAAVRFLDKLQGQGGARLKIRELDVSADKGARERLAGEVTGETLGEDLLERIFARFCIGK